MKKNSKFTGTAFHQGDTQWFELDALPEGVTRVEKAIHCEVRTFGSCTRIVW